MAVASDSLWGTSRDSAPCADIPAPSLRTPGRAGPWLAQGPRVKKHDGYSSRGGEGHTDSAAERCGMALSRAWRGPVRHRSAPLSRLCSGSAVGQGASRWRVAGPTQRGAQRQRLPTLPPLGCVALGFGHISCSFGWVNIGVAGYHRTFRLQRRECLAPTCGLYVQRAQVCHPCAPDTVVLPWDHLA